MPHDHETMFEILSAIPVQVLGQPSIRNIEGSFLVPAPITAIIVGITREMVPPINTCLIAAAWNGWMLNLNHFPEEMEPYRLSFHHSKNNKERVRSFLRLFIYAY